MFHCLISHTQIPSLRKTLHLLFRPYITIQANPNLYQAAIDQWWKKWSQGRNAKSNSSLNGPLKQVRQKIPVKAFFFLTIERKAALIRAEPAVLWCRCLIAEPRTWHTCSVKLFNWHCLIIYSRLHAGLDRHGNILTVFHDDASFKCKIQGLFSFYQTSE